MHSTSERASRSQRQDRPGARELELQRSLGTKEHGLHTQTRPTPIAFSLCQFRVLAPRRIELACLCIGTAACVAFSSSCLLFRAPTPPQCLFTSQYISRSLFGAPPPPGCVPSRLCRAYAGAPPSEWSLFPSSLFGAMPSPRRARLRDCAKPAQGHRSHLGVADGLGVGGEVGRAGGGVQLVLPLPHQARVDKRGGDGVYSDAVRRLRGRSVEEYS